MIRLSPRLLIGTANAFVGIHKDFGDHMEGALDVALVNHWGYWSHFDIRSEHSAWPLGAAITADALARLGAALDIVREHPEDGDVFLQRARSSRAFIRAGVVARVCVAGRYSASEPYFDVATIEGDSDEGGMIGGGRTVRVTRRLSPVNGDLFLRWVELDGFR